MAAAKRKTAIDKAIDVIDNDISVVEGQLMVLRAARERLVQQQAPSTNGKAPEQGHTEGGHGI
jgi:hypothetical protein